MRLKVITAAIVVLMGALGFVAWRNSTQPAVPEAAPPQAATPNVADESMAEPPADPGIEWKAPAGWIAEADRPMRLATYTIAGQVAGEVAECAVHYFGPGQGGTPEANIDRWLGEFENPRNPERTTQTVHGLQVSRARVRGAYQSHGGSSAEPQAEAATQSGQQLIGAIVEGPQGPVFFKLTGPSATVDRAAADFDRMIGSIRKR